MKANDSNPIADAIQRQADYPYRGSAEYQSVIADCVAAHQQQRKPYEASLGSGGWEPRIVAWLIALLMFLTTIGWIGCKTVEAIPSAMSSRSREIAIELAAD